MNEGENDDELLGICQSVTLTPPLTFYASSFQAPSGSSVASHLTLIYISHAYKHTYLCTVAQVRACPGVHTTPRATHRAQFMEGKETFPRRQGTVHHSY